jgi:hypothetical protein
MYEASIVFVLRLGIPLYLSFNNIHTELHNILERSEQFLWPSRKVRFSNILVVSLTSSLSIKDGRLAT